MKRYSSLQEFHKEIQFKAVQLGIPVYGGFELTPRCNLQCKMCYVSDNNPKNKELTTREWLQIGRDAAAAGALSVYLTGGDH
jgi:MoaA/NifB/PqqE/SkfB family radical SAM enzyme